MNLRSFKFIEYYTAGYFNTKFITYKIIDKSNRPMGTHWKNIIIGFLPDFGKVI